MTRPSRMILITVVIVLIGLTALFLIARQFEKKTNAARSVMDLPAQAPPGEIPMQPTETAEEVMAENGISSEGLTEEQQEYLRKVTVFANVRARLMEVLNENPKFKSSFQREVTGDTEGRDQVPMYNYELATLRVAKAKPLAAGGMSEEEYKQIRDWYRAWLSGEGDVDSAWKWAFENSPEEVMKRADMGIYDPTDF